MKHIKNADRSGPFIWLFLPIQESTVDFFNSGILRFSKTAMRVCFYKC